MSPTKDHNLTMIQGFEHNLPCAGGCESSPGLHETRQTEVDCHEILVWGSFTPKFLLTITQKISPAVAIAVIEGMQDSWAISDQDQ